MTLMNSFSLRYPYACPKEYCDYSCCRRNSAIVTRAYVIAKNAIDSKIKNRSGGRLADRAMCSRWATYLEAAQSERAKFRGRFR